MLDSLSSFPLTLQRSPQREGVIYSRFVHYREASIPSSRGALFKLMFNKRAGISLVQVGSERLDLAWKLPFGSFNTLSFRALLDSPVFSVKHCGRNARAFVQGDKFT